MRWVDNRRLKGFPFQWRHVCVIAVAAQWGIAAFHTVDVVQDRPAPPVSGYAGGPSINRIAVALPVCVSLALVVAIVGPGGGFDLVGPVLGLVDRPLF